MLRRPRIRYPGAFYFTSKSDGRIFAFGGDGHYSEGLANAAKNADVLFVERMTRKSIQFAPWGGDIEEEKVKIIGAYHMFPEDMKKLQQAPGVKQIVMVHVQHYSDPEYCSRLGVRDEMRDAGVENILLAEDGDLY